MAEREVQSPVSVKALRSALVRRCPPARAVILHVDAPTLVLCGRHMERAATAKSRES